MTKREILTFLKALVQALAESETPKPNPKPPPAPKSNDPPSMRITGERIEVWDGTSWQDASWVSRKPTGLILDDGLWIDPSQTRIIDNSPSGRYTQQRMTRPRDHPTMPR